MKRGNVALPASFCTFCKQPVPFPPMKTVRLAASLAVLCFAAGCAKKDPDHDQAAHTEHVHHAPHGGVLVELGEHAYNLEFVRELDTGKLSAYVLDGHAENFIRIKAVVIEVLATVGGEKRPLTFKAVANAATGETVGDTSQFDAEDAWLKTTPTFDGVIVALEVRGAKFANVAFSLKK